MAAEESYPDELRYHPEHDAWVCPEDQMLWPTRYDEGERLMRYQAKPSICNAWRNASAASG